MSDELPVPTVGERWIWVPTAFTVHTEAVQLILGAEVRLSGRVIEVNEAHRWFRVEAEFPGGKLRECFKF